MMSQLVIGLRVLRRQGLYGLMAVLGLAIGLAVAVTALLYTWQETHYDSHIPKADQIHLVDATVANPGRSVALTAQTPGGLADAVNGNVPGVLDAARLWRQWSTLRLDDAFNFNLPIVAVDANWIQMFELPMIAGTRSALDGNPAAIMISDTMAIRLFGRTDVVGQTILIDENAMSVEGVYAAFPTASHLEDDIIMNLQAPPVTNRRIVLDGEWRSMRTFTYLLLEKGADAAQVATDVETVLLNNFQPSGQLSSDVDLDDVFDVSVQSLSGLHMNGKAYPWGVKAPADKLKLGVFGAIAVLIVVIACINHVNMATVRAMERAREVAIRKIVGASRRQLVSQFLIEAAILVGISFVLALAVVEVSTPFTSSLLEADLDINALMNPSFILWLGGLMLFVVAGTGLYPAFIVSAVYPSRALASRSRSGGNSKMRSFLVVFQFSVSITLAIGAAVIWNQLSYARTADLGFNADNVVLLHGVGRPPQMAINLTRSLDQAISGKPGIELVSASNSTPAWDYVPEASLRLQTEVQNAALTIGHISVDLDFFEALEMQAVAGRLFSDDFGADRAQWEYDTRGDTILPVVINERAAFALGFPSAEAAVGQQAQFGVSDDNVRQAEIVGVVPNVHFKSLKNAIQPMAYYPDPGIFSVMMVKIDPSQRDIAMQSINEGWGTVMTGQALSYDYLSVSLAEQYDREAKELQAITVLAGLGILIAVFGQYGLAAYSAQSRRREIGIRKVLGARVNDILQLFLWQFSKPVFVAMVVAWPLAFLLMNAWLENFVYRISPNPLWFVLAGLAALIVALVTVAGHALTAARAAPIEALRYE